MGWHTAGVGRGTGGKGQPHPCRGLDRRPRRGFTWRPALPEGRAPCSSAVSDIVPKGRLGSHKAF